MTIPYDVSRCRGEQIDGEWREGCEDCLRRTSPGHPERQSYMMPPAIVAFECEFRLEPDTVQANKL